MSSNANALTQSDEPVELSALIAQTVKDYQKSQASKGGSEGGGANSSSQTASNGEPAPIRLNIDGQEREFADAQAVAQFYADREQQVRTAANTAVAAATAGASAAAAAKNVPAEPEFKPDVKKFADMLVENPGAAVEFALAEHWGVPKPFEVIKNLAAKVLEQEQVSAATQFKDVHPEYIANQHNAGEFQKIMQEYGLPMNGKGFELAYAVGKSRGAFELEQAETGQETGQSGYQPNPYQPQYQPQQTQRRPEAPPHARRNAQESAPIDWDAIEDLPTAEVEKIAQNYSRAVQGGRAR